MLEGEAMDSQLRMLVLYFYTVSILINMFEFDKGLTLETLLQHPQILF
jgi:hypothetical protein